MGASRGGARVGACLDHPEKSKKLFHDTDTDTDTDTEKSLF